MATRKLMQEVEKCYKKVSEGVDEFNSIYEKIEQSNNPAQKEKLEDNLKREIKKLQRLRDQIKTWATSSDVKDKDRLLEHRKLIETQMEKFKAVEKAMKTKAYSKEGLSAAAKLDPKEQAKVEMCDFLSNQVDALEQQVEALEAEGESLQATMRKGKANKDKASRVAEIERVIERHKWHQSKLELIQRSLENGGVDEEQVRDLKDSIEYYVAESMSGDFMEDEEMYDELDLGENEEAFGMNQDGDKPSSEEARSVQGDGSVSHHELQEPPAPAAATAAPKPPSSGKQRAAQEPAPAGRRPSTQLKSPLPTLATLHTPTITPAAPSASSSSSAVPTMKPASLPTRPAGEVLKYASAAAAAAAADKNLGIAPLPPPPTMAPVGGGVGINPLPSAQQAAVARSSAASSPAVAMAQLAAAAAASSSSSSSQVPETKAAAAPLQQQVVPPISEPTPTPSGSKAPVAAPASQVARVEAAKAAAAKAAAASRAAGKAPATAASSSSSSSSTSSSINGMATAPTTNGVAAASGAAAAARSREQRTTSSSSAIEALAEEEESQFHLPSCLHDLLDSYDLSRRRAPPPNSPTALRLLTASQKTAPLATDADVPRPYRPDVRVPANTATSGFPESPLAIFDDPRLYGRIDPDTLFYVFYYKQGSHHQYLAAKALKDQSWRFHKQYQTWFQRHEEPKNITEEFEQGTYRFFDYESTWMNRRKADFKFAYKFLEDEI